MMKNKHQNGFTLLEILIALFIFTIISIILVGALRSVINASSSTEKNATRLHDVQITLLLLSRDVEQIVNRPVFAAGGKEEPAFIGEPRRFTFTQVGAAGMTPTVAISSLKRTRYAVQGNYFIRERFAALDQVAKTPAHARQLLDNVEGGYMEYLDKDGRFHTRWPVEGQTNQPLPRAVRVHLTLAHWGTLSQLYVISAKTTTTPAPSPPPKP